MTKRTKPKQRDTIRVGTFPEGTNVNIEHLEEVVSIRVLSACNGRARLSIRFMPMPPERRQLSRIELALMRLHPEQRKNVSEMLAKPWMRDIAIEALRADGYDV